MAATTTFENAFVQGFAELSRAMAFHNRNNSKKSLSYDTLKPENFKSSFFYGRLPEDMKSYIKIIYDASLYGNNIVSGFLVNVNHRLHNCKIVQKSAYDIEHVYICDFKKTKTMIVPSDTTQYITLFNFVSSIIMDTDLLAFSSIKHGKRIKQKTHFTNNIMLNNLRKAISNGNELVIGKFAATLIWILHTKQMSVVQNAAMLRTGMAYCNGFNIESRILRTNPSAIVPQKLPEQPAHETIPEPTPEPQEKPQKIQNENVTDSWEDLEF